jgi:multidrug efflux pump subunit AcrA (membrane-fusion protein)
MTTDAPLPLTDISDEARALLAQVVSAQAAMAQAARDTTIAADELRRYAKFSKTGQPSPHIVQLRQKQATARIDSARAKQAFLHAAQGFARAAGLATSPRIPLESVVLRWQNENKASGAA